jgi:hypothetical protein
MNLQPDGATAVHSVLDLRRRLRFVRPKFEQSVSIERGRSHLTMYCPYVEQLLARSEA